ncbi:MAG: hypothetical protein C0513_01435 [Isosphaera sp.]|nr:hypothetical protein [Isosphaera sp.]
MAGGAGHARGAGCAMSGVDTSDRERLEEARLGLIAKTSAAERRNRPTTLLALGGVAAVVALGYTGWQLSARLAAREQLEAQEARAARLGELLGQIEALRLPGDGAAEGDAEAGGPDPLRRAPEQAQLLEDLAKELGFTDTRIVTSLDAARSTPRFELNEFRLSYSDEPTERVLRMLLRGPGVIEGMQVSGVSMRPARGTDDQRPTWNGVLSFSRWQRKPPG